MEYQTDPELQALIAQNRQRRIDYFMARGMPADLAAGFVDVGDRILQRELERQIFETGSGLDNSPLARAILRDNQHRDDR